jgi:predicted unusual protein kinase regulating ubiquinone biosynthesis (AarF/ABC1/UbiB family)
MNIFKLINKLVKTINLFSYSSYIILKYKCGFVAFEDAIISICDSFIYENYMFTKVVQWGVQEIYQDVNINNNDKLKNYFSTFCNNVRYSHDELLYSNVVIKDAIQYAKSRNDELVIENENEDENNGSYYIPINSGSVALIFKGRLNDTLVVIKILRPNIRNKIKEDVDILLNIFNNTVINKLIRYYVKINFKTFIISNVETLLNQCDFKCEVKNALLFKNNFKNKKNIIIPNFYTHFTETFEEVIIMEYLGGPVAKNIPLERLNTLLEPLQSFFFDSLFRYKILHGDFHLGNIIIMNNGNNIGIIDFGIVYFLTDELSNDLFNLLFLSFKKNDIRIFYKILKILIRRNCTKKNQYDMIFKIIKEDKVLEDVIRHDDYSANMIIKVINKLMSLENVEVVPDMCQLFLSVMSGLQTIEYTNNNKSLELLLKTYMNKCITI